MAISDKKEVLKAFGQILREHRNRLGLSQDQLSARCGVGGKDIGRIERGGRNPGVATVVDLARGLEIEPFELLKGLK